MFSYSDDVLSFDGLTGNRYRLVEESICRGLTDYDDGLSESYYAYYANGFGNRFFFSSINSNGEKTLSVKEIINDMSRDMYNALLYLIRYGYYESFIIFKINDQKPSIIIYSGEYPEYNVRSFIDEIMSRATYMSGSIVRLENIDGNFVSVDIESDLDF